MRNVLKHTKRLVSFFGIRRHTQNTLELWEISGYYYTIFSCALQYANAVRRNFHLYLGQDGIPKGLCPFGGVQRQSLWQVRAAPGRK